MKICDICWKNKKDDTKFTPAETVVITCGPYSGLGGIRPILQEKLEFDLCKEHQKKFGEQLLGLVNSYKEGQ